jgi:tetratricopeptide (TPR) repeat protein
MRSIDTLGVTDAILRCAESMSLSVRRVAWVAAVALLVVGADASAQLIDTVEVTRDGSNAVVRIGFGALVQYLRHVPVSEGQRVQVYFQITARDEASVSVLEEQRRPPPNSLLPGLIVTYPSQAPGLQRRLDVDFGMPVQFRIRPEDARTLVIVVPLSDEQIAKLAPPKPQDLGLPASEVSVTPQSEVERDASAFARDARSAMERGDFEQAVGTLNRLLNLPPNPWSQEAQEMIGIARLQLGEATKAKAEFDLYLKLYPEGPGAARVRKRLDVLAVLPEGAPATSARREAPNYWGSVSQYYYGGQQRTQATTTITTPATNATKIDTATLTATDQSQLVTNVDLTVRSRDDVWDNRVVVRNSYAANFLKGAANSNRLSALFFETAYQPAQAFGRFGRQQTTSNGVLGLFDGALGSLGIAPNWRVGAVVGQPVDTTSGTTKTFYGASLDADSLADRWSGNLFAVRQMDGGLEDRLGVGGEVHYFDSVRSIYTLFDYDPTFSATNIAIFQGTWQFATGTSVSALYDYRRAPTLQLTNALIVAPDASIDAIVQRFGLSATRDLAKAVTPVSRVAFVGLTQQVSTQWQLGIDFRLSSLSGTPAVLAKPAVSATGNIYTYSAQAIGNNLTKWQDILVVNASWLTAKTYDAQQATFDYRFTPWRDFVIEPMLRWYHQADPQGTSLTRLTPGLKVTWRVKDRLWLEAEGNLENSKARSPVIVDDVRRRFYYVGWRLDL